LVELNDKNFNLRDLIAIILHPDPDIAFRTSWLLENVISLRPETYLADLDYLLLRMLRVNAPGAKRHYAEIVMHLTEAAAPQIIKEKTNDIDFRGSKVLKEL
jgi:hypothetical protein